MPPRRNRDISDVYDRIMARIEERLYEFVDQFADRMNDMMNLRRHGDRNGQRSKGEESENLFFKGDGSSLFAKPEEWEYDGVVDDDYEESPVFDDDQFDDDYERPPVFDDDQFEEELEMVDDAFVLIGKEVAPDSKIPEARFHLHEEFCGVFPNELPDGLPPLRDIQRHIDLELPYHGDSSDDDLAGNSRTNFVYPWGNDAGLSVEERALLFLKAQDCVKEKA
ncbi:hypothetical protein Tco_0128154 [Tanacetum coccineum]